MTMRHSRLRKQGLFVAITVAVALSVGGPASANAVEPAPAWSVMANAVPSVFSSDRNLLCEEHPNQPEHCDHYSIVPTNVGARATEGLITVVDTLAPGVKTTGVIGGGNENWSWLCNTSESGGQEAVTCTTEESVAALSATPEISLHVLIPLSATKELSDEIEVSGGGAATADHATVATPLEGEAPIFSPIEFGAGPLNADGATETQAAGHPAGFFTTFKFPSQFGVIPPGDQAVPLPLEDVKQIVTDFPPGFLGDALAAPTCPLSDVTNLKNKLRQCPGASRVGKLVLVEPAGVETELTIFNVVPEKGYPAEFAVYLPSLQRAEFLFASVVGRGADAHIRVTTGPQDAVVQNLGVSLTFFGNPAQTDNSGLAERPFFTDSSDCTQAGLVTTMHVDSWQRPGRTANGIPDFSDPAWKSATSVSPGVTNCAGLQFQPSVQLEPDTTAPDTPTGLHVHLAMPQNEKPKGLATPPLKNIRVTLPQGLAVSASSAGGLGACSDEQFSVDSNVPSRCPNNSQLADIRVHSPLLEGDLEGQMFLGTPECAPCTAAKGDPQSGRMIRLFMQIHSDRYGVTVKLPGAVTVDPTTGRLTATFTDSPQLPFDDLTVSFKSGPRAALSTPSTCGTYTSSVDLTPWSSPATADAVLSPPFATAGCDDPAKFTPTFVAGTARSSAGSYAPFILSFAREDSDQQILAVSEQMPPGLLAKLAGIPLCSDAGAAAGNCPEASRIGSVTVGAGPGTAPFFVSGQVYLTGPYKGGPYGEVVEVPAIAGPFNLGEVVVRGAIYIDPMTAQARVVSDPFPTILDGIPLQTRSVSVTLDRPEFTVNPTSCAPMRVTATLSSVAGETATLGSRFQAADCASLPFKPQFSASTQGHTSKQNGASLHIGITSAGVGQANIAKVHLTIPAILPTRLTTIQKACTEAQFNANPAGCPPASNIATATVRTPLLNSPLTGPVYFVSHGGAAFPDTEIVLQGEGVMLILDGHTQITKGVTYSRFESVPDAPFTSFDFNAPEGPYSIFGANGNLCETEVRMPTTLVAQNGAVLTKSTLVEPEGCPYKLTILSHKVNKRTLTLKVAVPAAGKLTVSGKGLDKATKTAKGHSTLTLTLKAKGRGKLTTKVKLNFTPAKGRKLAATVPAKFKR